MSHRTWLLFICPAANLASRHTPETVTPSLGRDCAFARRQKWLLAKQQRMMILGDFLPSVPPPRLRKDVRRAALQYGKYTMSDLMLVLAYREPTAHSEPEGGYGCRTPLGSRPKIRGWAFSTLLWMDQPGVGDDGAFRATDTGVTWRCLHAMQSANRDCNHAIMMAIMQQRHVRQSRSTSTNNNSYYFNVIIYLSIYELGARHSYR